MVGGISLGASGNAVSCGPDSSVIGAHGLSASTIGSRGPTSHVLESSGDNFVTTGSGISDSSAGNDSRSLPRVIAATRWARPAAAVTCAQAAAAATMLNAEGMAVSLFVDQLLHFSTTRTTTTTTISIVLDDGPQEFLTTQLKDELVF
jgi:hypothetical protein